MSLGKLNYSSLLEEFCVEYFRVYKKLPPKSTVFTKENLIRKIHFLRRTQRKSQS